MQSASSQDVKELQQQLRGLKGTLSDMRQERRPLLKDPSEGLLPDTIGSGTALILSGNYQQTRGVNTPTGRAPGIADGSLSATLITGNPSRLSAEATLVLNDVSDPGQRCSINGRVGRFIGDTFFSFGVDQLVTWGGTDTLSSWSLKAGRTLQTGPEGRPFSRVYLHAGIGNGRYAPEGAINRIVNGKSSPDMSQIGFFGSVGTLINKRVMCFGRYFGNDWTVGASFRTVNEDPARKDYMYFTVGLADITGRAGDGSRLTLAAGIVLPLGK
jgi:hypothetical protein